MLLGDVFCFVFTKKHAVQQTDSVPRDKATNLWDLQTND